MHREFGIRPHPHDSTLVGLECPCGFVLYGDIDFAVDREHDLMACHGCGLVLRVPVVHQALDAALQAQDLAETLQRIAASPIGGRTGLRARVKA